MKRVTVILLSIGIFLSMAAYSQNTDLTKLSQQEREKRLFEIAVEAMKKYAPSYYREDLKPVIKYQGVVTYEKDKYFGKMVYAIEFPFDMWKAREELEKQKEGDDNMYGGSVSILGETGEAIVICPTGWMVQFEIDKKAKTRKGQHEVAKPVKIPENPFRNHTKMLICGDSVVIKDYKGNVKEIIPRDKEKYPTYLEMNEKKWLKDSTVSKPHNGIIRVFYRHKIVVKDTTGKVIEVIKKIE